MKTPLPELRFRSIAGRWFLGIFSTVSVLIVAAAVALCLVFHATLEERAQTRADDYSYGFNTLSSADPTTFLDASIRLSESFAYKKQMEVQVLNAIGQPVVSTTGFQPAEEKSQDFSKAVSSKTDTYFYRGKSASGEAVMARTNILRNKSGQVLGAYRWVISLAPVRTRQWEIALSLGALSAVLIAFFGLTGVFFLRSIVKPIRGVSNVARKIAMGDFEGRLTVDRNDEIGELCDSINYMAAELSQAQLAKNDFVSSISHELRTPLTAIRGWSETARMAIGTDQALVERGLDVVLGEADRLSGLVEELLDFSRMESGRLSINPRWIDLTTLLIAAADMYAEVARQRGLELSFSPPDAEATVLGDPDRLKQVFINIIDNAVKYTEKGGQVLMEQTFEEGCVRVVIKDTGIGIPAQDIDHVKEKFFKANKTVRGSGIGLAVADEIIKQHQGLLLLESTEGVGTAVTVVLPLGHRPEPEKTEKEEE